MKKSNRIFWSGIGLVFVTAISVLLVFSLLGRIYVPSNSLHQIYRDINSQQTIKGNRNIARVEKDLPTFNKIMVSGDFVVTVIPGHAYKITMESDDNILKKMMVSVEEGKLEIRADKSTRLLPSSSVKIFITIPELLDVQLAGDVNFNASNLSLSQLKVSTAGHNNVTLMGLVNKLNLGLSGASNINLLEIKSQSINVTSAGAGNLKITGTTDHLSINNAGEIDLNAKNLVAKKVSIAGAGSGNIDVHAINQIMLNTLGKFSIHYTGNPAIINHSSGSLKLFKE